MKALLGHFGPLSVADSKVQLLLRSLPGGMRADPAYSPDGLCRLLEANANFVVHQDVYFLAKDVSGARLVHPRLRPDDLLAARAPAGAAALRDAEVRVGTAAWLCRAARPSAVFAIGGAQCRQQSSLVGACREPHQRKAGRAGARRRRRLDLRPLHAARQPGRRRLVKLRAFAFVLIAPFATLSRLL